MNIDMLFSKLHRAAITDANLNYVAAITIDSELMDAAKLRVGQKVDIVNVNNGERFSTYVIEGEKGKKDICLNGAAARKAEIGDIVIIIAYASMTLEEADSFKPHIVLLNSDNEITGTKDYV
jgi:aspartate 1-decarboxylase